MKKAFLTVAAITAATGLNIVSANAAELTGNAGLVSNYVFRGADASNGKAAAQGGLDLSAGMFYAGTWLSSVQVANNAEVLDTNGNTVGVKETEDSGVEVDLYAGFGDKVGDFNWGVGATYYGYTDNVIDPFIEANLSAGWKWLSISINPGKFLSNERENNIKLDQEYVYYEATAEVKGFYGTAGYWDWDQIKGAPDRSIKSAGYFELGYGDTLTVNNIDLFDYKISYVYADRDLIANDQSQNTLIFGITKNFSILK